MTQTATLSIRNLFSSIVLLAVLAISGSSNAFATVSATEMDCSYAVPVELNSSLRGQGIHQNNVGIYSVDLPEAGIFSIDVSATAGSDELPRLGLLNNRCEGGAYKNFDLTIIERSASRLIVVTRRGGTYFFRIGSQDENRFLSAYRLSTGFVSFEDASVDPMILVTKIVTEEEDEMDPDPGSQSTAPFGGPIVATKIVTEEEDEMDPDPGSQLTSPFGGPIVATKIVTEEEDEMDPDPGKRSIATITALRAAIGVLCEQAVSDDHADTLTCATRLSSGESLAGHIDNNWGDDDDLFVVDVTELSTIQIETTGTTDVRGELYSAFGERLTVDDNGGDENNFRIVRTLTPGRYFVRVSGTEYEEGAYSLNTQTLDW